MPNQPPVGYLLKQVQSVLRARLDETLARHGFSAAQYVSLNLLAENSGMSGAALARAAFVTPQTMQGILDGLEKNGHITRQPSPDQRDGTHRERAHPGDPGWQRKEAEARTGQGG